MLKANHRSKLAKSVVQAPDMKSADLGKSEENRICSPSLTLHDNADNSASRSVSPMLTKILAGGGTLKALRKLYRIPSKQMTNSEQ